MAIAPDGMPYVAYRGGASSFAPNGTVKKYNGTSWAQVATDFSTSASSISLAFAPDGSPYVAYKDGLASSKATVKRFNGTSWVTVGSAGFSNGQVDYISLAFAPDGTPYLAYQDASTTPTKKATVSQFDGTNWVVVGSAGFSAGQANGVTLAIAQDGTLYVAYADSTTSPIGMATVMKYDTSTWVNVGIAGFSAGAVQHSSLAIAPDGKPYLAYVDGGNSNNATVMMYDGSAWANAGNAGFTLGSTGYTALAFSLDGVPYVGFSDSVLYGTGTVMKLSPQQTHANVTVTTNVAGLGINVDGLDYTTPHTFAWATGSDHSISAHSPQLLFGESGTQYRFNDWSDGGGQTHSIATPNTNTTYTANFTRQYQLTGAVDSTSHGYWQFCILDCYTMSQNGQLWLDEGDRRVISAKAYDGFKFSNWTGSVDYPNSSPTLLVTMTGPKSVTANFTGIPKLAAKVIGKSGPDNNRVWTIALTNTGTGGPAINANITGMYYAVTSGKDCQIYGYYSFPIVVGEIPQGAQGSGVVNWINYAECPSSNRYTMVFSYDYQDASGHSYFGTTAFYNIQR
ncbi:MAG: hypothetical protein NTX45_18095 [Proteobacteria bacterium]|nr:hypothetical protein [Pseudomonadota bacterium]